MKYDAIVAVGCSYINGSNILYEDDTFAGRDYRVSKILSNELNVPEINLSFPGGSNERIFREAYNWVIGNTTYKNPFFLIGLTGITRTSIFSVYRDAFFDVHIFDFPAKEKESYNTLLNERTEKLLGPDVDSKIFENWIEVSTKYMFDLNAAENILQREVMFLDSFLKMRGINYILFNSINDSIDPIKDKINYFSFNLKNLEVKHKNNDGLNQVALHDCWYHYLRERHTEVCEDFNDYAYRSSKPEWGKWFCGGHPSPGANRDLADKLLKLL